MFLYSLSSIHGRIRDFSSLPHWKANELKVFLLYTGLPILFKYLKTEFFEHFCLYILIIRRLCDTNMSDKQHDLTESLLRIWHKDLEVLYGDKNMTFTAHAHLHLVDQVKRLGPLNKLEAFCFEGFLKHIKDKVNGTRYIGATIVKRIILEQNCIKKVLEVQVPHIQDYAADHLLPKVYKKDASSDDNIRSSSEKLNLVEANVLKSFDKSITNVSIIECFSRIN